MDPWMPWSVLGDDWLSTWISSDWVSYIFSELVTTRRNPRKQGHHAAQSICAFCLAGFFCRHIDFNFSEIWGVVGNHWWELAGNFNAYSIHGIKSMFGFPMQRLICSKQTAANRRMAKVACSWMLFLVVQVGWRWTSTCPLHCPQQCSLTSCWLCLTHACVLGTWCYLSYFSPWKRSWPKDNG